MDYIVRLELWMFCCKKFFHCLAIEHIQPVVGPNPEISLLINAHVIYADVG